MPDRLRLSRAQLEAVHGHALACAPEEACGILAGDSEGNVSKVFLMENAEHSHTFYLMDSQEQFQVFDEMQAQGLEITAIFHSHPHSPAFPSAHDLELAFYPDSIYMIVSLAGAAPEDHAFSIVDGQVREVGIVVEDENG